jgi:hypothetical protein
MANVELARRAAEAMNRGDVAAALALIEAHLAPDYQFDPLYLDRVYSGTGALRQAIADAAESWQEYRNEIEDIVDLGEHLLHVSHITGRGPGGGVPVDYRVFMLTRFDGDQAVWTKSFPSKAEALEAAGLRE